MTSLGAWLWLEWWRARKAEAAAAVEDARREEVLQQDRAQWGAERDREWLERVNEEKSYQAYQDFVAKAWQETRKKYLQMAEVNPAMEKWVDRLDDGYDKVCRNGVWDLDDLQKLERDIQNEALLQNIADNKAHAQHFIDSAHPAVKGAMEASRCWWLRLGTDMATKGFAEAVRIPLSTMDHAYEAVKHGADPSHMAAFKDAFWQTASLVLWDRVFVAAEGAFKPELDQAKNWAREMYRGVKQMASETLDDAATGARARLDRWRTGPTQEAPVIRQKWGDPVSYFDKPLSPPSKAPVPRNWIEQNAALESINRSLAADVNRLMRQEGGFKMQSVESLGPGQTVQLTADELAGHRLLQNVDYLDAVREGNVPRKLIDLTNHSRDKLAKLAVGRTLEKMPEEITERMRIDFTGKGARPHSPSAVSGLTDLDLSVMVDDTPKPGETLEAARAAARRAEQKFVNIFNRELANGAGEGVPGLARIPDPALPGGGRFLADVHAFPGVNPSGAPTPGGFSSPEMIEFVRRDNIFRGVTAIKGSKGTVYFGGNPDVRPMPGYGPLEQAPRWKPDAQRAVADVQRLVGEHAAGQPGLPTMEEMARQDGKDAWWAVNKGKGLQPPPWIKTHNQVHLDRTYQPPPGEWEEAVKGFSEFLNNPDVLMENQL